MSYPHRIRLRGPWECDDGQTLRRVKLPCPAAALEAQAQVKLARGFGYPGQIDAGEHVWLCLEGLGASAQVSLNSLELGVAPAGAWEHEVTSLLCERNRLELILTPGAGQGLVWSEVALEIRRDAYLRAQVLRGPAAVAVEGKVEGTCDAALELYLFADHVNLAYQPVRAGTSFSLTAGNPNCSHLRLELVAGAVVWYVLELPVEGP